MTRAIDPMIAAFQNQIQGKSQEMREVGVKALLKINKSRAVEPFIQILSDEKATDGMRAVAAWALIEMDDNRANEALLLAHASGGNSDVRMNTAWGAKRDRNK